VADPDILRRGRWSAETMYPPSRHLSQMHTTNYMPFIREKGEVLKKF